MFCRELIMLQFVTPPVWVFLVFTELQQNHLNSLLTKSTEHACWKISTWFLRLRVATPPAPYRSLPGPPGPESRKSLKRVSRDLPAPGSKKCPKQSRNSLRSLKTVYFETPETVSRLFRTLFGPSAPGTPKGAGILAPGDSFETLSGFRARRARETPVRGGRGCKLRVQSREKVMIVSRTLSGMFHLGAFRCSY